MSNSRRRGNHFELQIVNELKEMGYGVATSRQESRAMDAKKVDIVSVNHGSGKDLPYHIQCKNTKTHVKYWEILNVMPTDKIPVIVHKKTRKVNLNFITEGEYVVMSKENFYNLLLRRN